MDTPACYFRWSEDGEHIYFLGHERGDNDLWAVTFEGANERRLTRFSQRPGSLGQFGLAVDKAFLYFTWRMISGISG